MFIVKVRWLLSRSVRSPHRFEDQKDEQKSVVSIVNKLGTLVFLKFDIFCDETRANCVTFNARFSNLMFQLC